MFVCVEGGTSQWPPPRNGSEDSERGARRGVGFLAGGGCDGKRRGVLTPEAFEARLLRGTQSHAPPMPDSPLRVTEEFIDDDPAEISFYAGGAEAYSFGPEEDRFDYGGEPYPAGGALSSVGIEDLFPNRRLFPDGFGGRSETSSLVNSRSEGSHLDNLGLASGGESMSAGYGGGDSSSLGLPGSDMQSEASSMVNFPACSVRSEGSCAAQFGDLVEQFEQLSYPPTATEGSANGSSDSDSDWGSDSVLPPEQKLFHSDLLMGSGGIEDFIRQYQNLQALALADPPASPHVPL